MDKQITPQEEMKMNSYYIIAMFLSRVVPLQTAIFNNCYRVICMYFWMSQQKRVSLVISIQDSKLEKGD